MSQGGAESPPGEEWATLKGASLRCGLSLKFFDHLLYFTKSNKADSAPPVGSYFKRPKSSPVCPLACNWLALLHTVYSQAQGCVCAALQLGGDVEQPWLMSKYDVVHKNRKYITYHYAARGGPSHGHAQKNAVKIGRVVAEI